jgi:hypothetical protein
MPSTVTYTEHELVKALVTDLAILPELRYSFGWVARATGGTTSGSTGTLR